MRRRDAVVMGDPASAHRARIALQECRKLRNFSSMSAIVNALQSSSITALVITHDNSLNKQEKRVLQRLDSLLEPERNHRAYREALRASDAPCVPWLGASGTAGIPIGAH